MGDMGDFWNDIKQANRERREREGWISNRFKTEKERNRSIAQTNESNYRNDEYNLRILKKMGLDVEIKGNNSYQIKLENGKVMLYTGIREKFIYIAQKKKKISLYSFWDKRELMSKLKEATKYL